MNNIEQILKHDDNLREAIRRNEEKQPTLPANLNERFMQRFEQQERRAKHRHTWFYPAIAVAASILLLLLLHEPRTENPIPSSQEASYVAEANSWQYEDEWAPMEKRMQRQQEIRERGERLSAYIREHRSSNIK